MNKTIVYYHDSNLIDEQTDKMACIARITAIGFVLRDSEECIILARELIGDEYRGQIAIPKKSIFKIEKLEVQE